MSHTVTITRTTVASSGTAVFINTGYLGTLPGLLKLAQLNFAMHFIFYAGLWHFAMHLKRLMGAACVGIIGYYFDRYSAYRYDQRPELFFLLVATAFLIGTFCLLTACLVSLSTASMISKTIYEVIYHGIAFIFYLCAGLTLMIEINHSKGNYRGSYEAYLAAAIMGLVLAGLYLLSTFLANRQYRGI